MKKPNVLVLNADYLPFDIVSWQRGIKKLFSTAKKDRAYIVEEYEQTISDSKGQKYNLPAVIALKHYQHINYKVAKYSRINVFCRDGFTCQYCGKKFKKVDLTVDHIIPRSKWDVFGRKDITVSSFENVTTACKRCNTLKGDKIPQECGLTLLSVPRKISMHEAFLNRCLFEERQPEWEPYLESLMNVK